MRIAIVVNGRAHEGGVTTYINTIAHGLRGLGHQVDVVTIFGISEYRPVKTLFVQKTDAVLTHRPILTLLAYVASKIILAIWLMLAQLRKKYDAVLAMDISAANVAVALRRIWGWRVVERVGASVPRDLIHQGKLAESSAFRGFFEMEEHAAFRRADVVMPNSAWSERYVRALCPAARLVAHVISPVDPRVFRPDRERGRQQRQKLNLGDDAWVILMPGRLERRKGTLIAAQALERLLSLGAGYFLVYAGDGPDRRHIEHYAAEHGLQANIRLLGRIAHGEMGALYNMADVTVIPPLAVEGWEEPLPNCILESMACGAPVIASNTGGLSALVAHEKIGLLVPESDAVALAAAVVRLRAEPAFKVALAENALQMIQERCSPDGVARRLAEILNPQASASA